MLRALRMQRQVIVLWQASPQIILSCHLTSFLLRLLDSTHQALIVHVMYYYLVQNYLNARALLDTVW